MHLTLNYTTLLKPRLKLSSGDQALTQAVAVIVMIVIVMIVIAAQHIHYSTQHTRVSE